MSDKQYLLLPEYLYLQDSYKQQTKNLGAAVIESWKQQADRLDRGASQEVVNTTNGIVKAIGNILANSMKLEFDVKLLLSLMELMKLKLLTFVELIHWVEMITQ